MNESDRLLASQVGMDESTWKKYVSLIRPLLARENFMAARALYREIVETYGYVRIADAIYAEAKNGA